MSGFESELSEARFVAFEDEVGLKLPNDYRVYLRSFDGVELPFGDELIQLRTFSELEANLSTKQRMRSYIEIADYMIQSHAYYLGYENGEFIGICTSGSTPPMLRVWDTFSEFIKDFDAGSTLDREMIADRARYLNRTDTSR